MLNFIIKTHRVGTIYTKPHLFVLNKGMNSGKPQKAPFTNSFVIIFQNEEDCESVFFIAYSLWQTKFWHPFLVGSVIPFLRLNDFKKEYNSYGGNAYGMANTLLQTAVLRPKLKSKKVKNLYFTGQLTVPGPGVPPALISGKLVAQLIKKYQ